MTKKEYVGKCKSVIVVLNKIIDGTNVSFEKRMKACENAIKVLCYDGSQNPPYES